jgi:DnaJ-domain-containing protein 1
MARRLQQEEETRRLAEEAARGRAKEEEERKHQAERRRRFEEWKRRKEEGGSPRAVNPQDFDPYAVLGIPRSADRTEVKDAYRRLMGQYHPDKVAHLGPELREVAHRKSQEVARAYRMLSER